MSAPEFSRIIKLKAIAAGELELSATADERTALASRFGIESVESLDAKVVFEGDGPKLRVTGTMVADVVQSCAISGEDFPHRISEALDFVFVPAGEQSVDVAGMETGADIEIELQSDELDEIEYDGDSFDLGEAIAQSLGLAIDPYAEGPGADAARKNAGISSDDAPSGPLAEALKGLTGE